MPSQPSRPALQVIGLSGEAGSGKDYIASHFLRGFLPVSLADHFKITIAGRGLASYDEVFHTKPPAVRTLLQEEGTERGRNVYGEMVWCRTLEMFMTRIAERWGMTQFVVADIRFPNEVEWVQSIGGQVWRLQAPNRVQASPLSAAARAHISERALDRYTGFDAYLLNDYRDVFTIGAQVKELVRRMQARSAAPSLFDGCAEVAHG